MAVPTSLPFPRSNMSEAGLTAWASGIASTDLIVALGDYSGGAADDLFTLTSHGLISGDQLYFVSQDTVGALLGGPGTRVFAKVLSSSTFTPWSNRLLTTAIENTADGTVVFLKTNAPAHVAHQLVNRIIVANGDFTGGTTEDLFNPHLNTGAHGLVETDTIKLLYKSAAGVLTGISVGTTVFAKSVTPVAFETAATSGGADIENTADGLAVFLKTS